MGKLRDESKFHINGLFIYFINLIDAFYSPYQLVQLH